MAEEWSARHAWKAFIADCYRGPAGCMMAGAGLFVRSYIGAAHLDRIPEVRDHKLVKSWGVAA
eukprot:7383325-Pyramimonas_sp.AAC.1